MKTNIQSPPKLIAACALTLGAIVLNAHWILGLNVRAVSGVSERASVPPATCQNGDQQAHRTNRGRHIQLDPVLDFAGLALSEGKVYEGDGRNIFAMSIPTHVIGDQQRPKPEPPALQQRPATRPFPLKFFGFVSLPDTATRIFLSQDNDVFIGSEDDIVNRRYKILRIGRQSVDVEDLLDNTHQTLPLNES